MLPTKMMKKATKSEPLGHRLFLSLNANNKAHYHNPAVLRAIGERPASWRRRRRINVRRVRLERLNGTQRLFLKRLNRLTLCFSTKLENQEAAFAMFAAYHNWCWQTRHKGTSGKLRPTACMMAGLEGHVWSFDELFAAVLA